MRYLIPSLMGVIVIAATASGALAQPVLPFGSDGWETDWKRTSISFDELSVNVRRDQIPPIDHPRYVSIAEASRWLDGQEPVVHIRFGEESRAYPLQVLIWHEIVNDQLGGHPVTVTFCPLCYSAVAFEREVDGELLDFGVSGMLRHSDLVMYDRQTHSLWQQITGDALVGHYTGTRLKRAAAQIVSFDQFRKANPEGDVLSRETGHERPYGANPYVGYDNVDERPFLYKGPIDDRLPPMEKVIGVRVGDVSKAYAHRDSREARVIEDELGGTELVVLHARVGATSALDEGQIAESRMIGSTGVFERRLGDRLVDLKANGQAFVDRATGSRFDITGLAIDGPLKGQRLRPVEFLDVFAFAWFVMMPNTELYRDAH